MVETTTLSGTARVPAADLHDTEPLWVVELTARERDEAGAAIDEGFLAPVLNAGIEPGTTDFFNAGEIAEGMLPERARAALAALRRGTVPAVLIRGLPADADPGPTPIEPGDPSTSPRRGYAWISIAVRRLGDEFAYALEKQGALVHSIYPTAQGATTQSNASFKVDLGLHTENAFHPIRPDWVALYCVRTPPEAPSTRLVFLDEVLAQLTDDEIAVLREPRFTIRVVDSHLAEGEKDIALPVAPLSGSPRDPVIRWHETLTANDDVAERAMRAFSAAAKRATRYVTLGEGDMLVFANEFCLHGRDKFEARLDGTDRWTLRGYALRDITITRPFVTPARPRVTRIDLSAHAGD
jgi:L-asparagine oxygenase